ncbi:hypothetical protein PRUB_b0221 [Pseudoalteromonas rubra]|uniref:DUF4410 domain-containing protein n=1 Tax=Pseudoalteromonas rubra TaxID=43658 RepID=A0A8T0BZ55_9GAMM|nr:hypothetical protein [Pseudoalteromonas rubra]KAF7781106.1 hypothetical protein PRUB_b0221 [Pseudoalteromonas rubra]
MKKLIASAVVAIALSGCTSVNITSYVDPKFRSVKYANILVDANMQDFAMKSTLETAVCDQFAKKLSEVTCLKATDHFPPTRQYTQQEWRTQFEGSGAQARLQIELLSKEKMAITSTRMSANQFGFNSFSSNTTTNIENKFQITMIDKGDQAVAMTATGVLKAQETIFAGNKAYMRVLAKEITKELLKKQLLETRQASSDK